MKNYQPEKNYCMNYCMRQSRVQYYLWGLGFFVHRRNIRFILCTYLIDLHHTQSNTVQTYHILTCFLLYWFHHTFSKAYIFVSHNNNAFEILVFLTGALTNSMTKHVLQVKPNNIISVSCFIALHKQVGFFSCFLCCDVFVYHEVIFLFICMSWFV